MLVEHPLQVHGQRCESLRASLGDRRQDRCPAVEQTPEARIGAVIVTRLPPFVDHGGERPIGHKAALERAEDQTFRTFVSQHEMLETVDTFGFDLLELTERTDGLSDGFAETILSESRVLAGNEQVGSECQVVAAKHSGPGTEAKREALVMRSSA